MENRIVTIRVSQDNDEMLKHLANQENRSKYITELIKADMAKVEEKDKIKYLEKWLDAIIELSAPFPEEQKAYKNCKEKIKEVKAL